MGRAPRRGSTTPGAASVPLPATPGSSDFRSNNVQADHEAGPPKLYLSRPFVEATLVKGSFKTLVALPKYLDVLEWVAMNSMLLLFALGLSSDGYHSSV